MSEGMCISVNGHSQVPPGFRFHPTEEELLHYYLKKKVSYQKIDLDVITDVDLNKLEPWDIQDKCKIGTTPQNDWYFFSHKDKKYPTGTRTNRATAAGFWKATGRDKTIFGNGRRIGMRKTLVFYKGRAPHGQKSDWIMHEYRLDDNTTSDANVSNALGDDQATQEEGWVVCRIFKKKNHHKTLESPLSSSSIITEETGTQMISDPYSSEGALDQMLEYMGRSCKEESEANNNIIHSESRFLRPIETNRFMKLPSLESPNSTGSKSCYQPMATENESSITNNHQVSCTNTNQVCPLESGLTNWSALDRLVASHLNGQSETSRQLTFFNNDPTHMGYCNPNYTDHHQGLQFPSLRSSLSLTSNCNSNRSSCPGAQDYNNMINNEMDLWSFTTCTTTTRSSSSSDPLFHVSNYSV